MANPSWRRKRSHAPRSVVNRHRRLVAALLLPGMGGWWAGCASTNETMGGEASASEVVAVQESIVRWLTEHYEASEFLGEAQGYCLVVFDQVGTQRTALNMTVRPPEYDPTPGLMGRIGGLSPAVRSISGCVRDDNLVERFKGTDERAVAMAVGYPNWVTSSLARVQATMQESAHVRSIYACSAERGREGWIVGRCISRS